MSNQNSLQASPNLQNSLNNSFESSNHSVRSYYSSPNKQMTNSLNSSPTKKKFVIKNKVLGATSTSNFSQLSPHKIQSSTSINEIIERKPIVLPGKQTILYRQKVDTSRREKTYMNDIGTIKKNYSLQNIPLQSGVSHSSSPKKQPMVKLKPLNRHNEGKPLKNQTKLDDLLQKVKNDEVNENMDKDLDLSIEMSLEERKEEEESSPYMALKKAIEDEYILNLVNHGLKDETAVKMIEEKYEAHIKKMYLIGNSLGNLSLEKILDVSNRFGNDCKLSELDLEDTEFTDQLAIILFNNMGKMKHLKILNLTNNFLSHSCSSELKNMLATNTSLKELYIRKNKLTGIAGMNLFQGLLLNTTLKVLDLSWNILTMKTCADAIAKVLRNDTCPLTHLDLSYNNFSLKESELIASGLQGNHQLYGFHYEGNWGYVNSKGFLIIPHNCRKEQLIDYNESRRIKGLKSYPLNYIPKTNAINLNQVVNKSGDDSDEETVTFKDCCWLCDAWHETVFELSLDELSDLPPVTRVFIHIDIDDFHGTPMSKPNPKATKYVYRKVLPASRITFFFTVNDLQITSEKFFTLKNPNPFLKNIRLGEMVLAELEIKELNFIESSKVANTTHK